MVDPSEAELAAINTVADAAAWSGVDEFVLAGLRRADCMGNFAMLRQIVLIPQAAWEAGLVALRVGNAENGDRRVPTPLEQGHVGSLRRVARLRCSLDPDTGAPASTGPGAAAGGGGAGPGGAASALGATFAGQRKLKTANVLDQADDSEIPSIEPKRVRALLDGYKEDNDGEEAGEDEEPTGEQFAALDNKLTSDVAPYADFAVFRPFGARLQRAVKFTIHVLNPNGTWSPKEIAGPANFQQWRASWRVYRVGMCALKAVSRARLDLYEERMRELHSRYGSEYWWGLAMAGIRLRRKQLERYRRTVEAQHAVTPIAGSDTAKPGDYIFMKAATDDAWGVRRWIERS